MVVSKVLISAALALVGVAVLRRKGFRALDDAAASRFSRLCHLLVHCIPSTLSAESAIIAAVVCLVVLRLELVIKTAVLRSAHVRELVDRRAAGFARAMAESLLWSVPSAILASLSTLLVSLLAQRFRRNLQRSLHDRVLQLGNGRSGVTLVEHPDQRLTDDATVFCSRSADLLPSAVGPALEVTLFSVQLLRESSTSSAMLSVYTVAYYVVGALFLNGLLPDIAALDAQLQEREGDLRTVYRQVFAHSEEVAFYRGESTERELCNRQLDSLLKRWSLYRWSSLWSAFSDSVVTKYGSTTVGYAICSIPVFQLAGKPNVDPQELTRAFMLHQQLYLPLSIAVGKLLKLRSRVALAFSGAMRISPLLQPLEAPSSGGPLGVCLQTPSNRLQLESVDIVSLTGIPLLHHVTFSISPGQHTCLTGSNGVGKSTLVHVIAGGLSTCQTGGTIQRPLQLAVSPQRTYLIDGSLFDQLCYPMTRKPTEATVLEVVELVGLRSVVAREGGLAVVKPWRDVLSGGEQQRVALARIWLQRPMFAILDECSGAIPPDEEMTILETMQNAGVTLITISHRTSVQNMHAQIVSLDTFRCR